MKVWIAVGGWNSEGYDLPIGVFTTVDAAQQAFDEGYAGFDCRTILVYTLDSNVRGGSTERPEEIDYNEEWAARRRQSA